MLWDGEKLGDEHEEVKKVCVMDPKVHVECLWGAEAGHKTTTTWSMCPFRLPFSSVVVLFFLLGCNETLEKKSVQLVCAMNLSLVVFGVCVHRYCQRDCDHLFKMCWLEENVLIKHGTYLILTMVLHTACFLLLWFCVCILVANRDYLVHSQPPTPTPKKSRKTNKTILLK